MRPRIGIIDQPLSGRAHECLNFLERSDILRSAIEFIRCCIDGFGNSYASGLVPFDKPFDDSQYLPVFGQLLMLLDAWIVDVVPRCPGVPI